MSIVGSLIPPQPKKRNEFFQFWRLLTIVLTTLATGMSFSHVLELPAKRQYGTKLYLSTQKSLYDLYGTAGAAVEGSWLCALVLLFFIRNGAMNSR